jgi:hypothetical protein
MRERNGLGSSPRLSQSSYRQAVSETVRHLQGSDTDQDMADRWGVSDGTVMNARNRNHDLSPIPLLKLGERWRGEGLNTVLALIKMKAVDEKAIAIDAADIPCEVAECVPELIKALHDGDCTAEDVHKLDQAGVIDTLCKVAESLRQHRDRLRLRVA